MSVFVTGAGKPPVPINYINYIETNGTQYIDTGFKPNNNSQVIDENGVVCLYDKVSKQYVYNSGTGEFVGG